MDALLWAILTAALLALAVLRLCSPQHAAMAMRAALGLWIATTLFILPLLLARS